MPTVEAKKQGSKTFKEQKVFNIEYLPRWTRRLRRPQNHSRSGAQGKAAIWRANTAQTSPAPLGPARRRPVGRSAAPCCHLPGAARSARRPTADDQGGSSHVQSACWNNGILRKEKKTKHDP